MKKITALYGNDYYNNINTIRLLVFLIDKCNYVCSYCYNNFPRKNILLCSDDIIRFVLYVNKCTGKLVRIEFIGGEVALYEKLYDLCKKLHSFKYVIDIEIYTNLFKDILFYNSLILDCGVEVNATWHSIPYNKNNNTFIQKILSVQENIFKHYYITIMFEPNAIAESKNAYNELRKKYPYSHNIEYSLCIYKNTNTPYEYTTDDLEYFYTKCKLTSFNRKEFYIEYNDNTLTKLTFNDLLGLESNCFKYWSCNVGIDFLYIDVNGNVYKCTHDSKDNALMNILQHTYQHLPTKPYICKYDYCPCTWEIYRKRIFK